jgi:hypothetical protein
MLDERTRMMLEVANTLTAEDLDFVRGSTVTRRARPAKAPAPMTNDSLPLTPASQSTGVPSRGERERLRTRDSKVSTACLGSMRPGHQWWPIGTELVGIIGAERFTARVVENPQVKSGRSVLITSGPAQGRICITPTRAAIEATEGHRQTHNLGRGGGVTNGWTFWKPQTGSQ